MQTRRAVVVLTGPSRPASDAVVAGGFVFASAQTGLPDGDRPAPGDVGAETRRALERLGRVLEGAGSSLEETVAVSVFLRRASDFAAMNDAYRPAFGDRPPTRTTVVADIAGGALVAVAAIAVPRGSPRETLHPPGWVRTSRPYSYIVRANGFVFLSGLLSRRGADDQVVPGPVATQTRTILENAGVLLKTAGLTFDDVVAARVFLTDDSLFEAMNDEYRRVFAKAPPARATAVTDLVAIDASIEITLLASATGKTVIGPSVSPSLPLSSAVAAGPFVFLSGVLGNTEANATDVSAQTREVFSRTRATLDQAGLSFVDVVDTTVYLTDVWQLKTVEALTREVFPVAPPSQTVVGARLVTRTGLVEMMMTAVR
jgi:2-iminobutanoate/2-iminopropanoate deaminase